MYVAICRVGTSGLGVLFVQKLHRADILGLLLKTFAFMVIWMFGELGSNLEIFAATKSQHDKKN